ncbi:hypothetical protein CDCA_CDCA15G4034 [Cyanidium caldarium]|uniref:Uncharacterized protein n=1 Tax=Cyanidium caldarium TaxID=2771 RepID=A0AAV9J121_CYACA|nr:hypothetical protein CDCA_CDCA15G4034 [Cyanidium caldarium]
MTTVEDDEFIRTIEDDAPAAETLEADSDSSADDRLEWFRDEPAVRQRPGPRSAAVTSSSASRRQPPRLWSVAGAVQQAPALEACQTTVDAKIERRRQRQAPPEAASTLDEVAPVVTVKRAKRIAPAMRGSGDRHDTHPTSIPCTWDDLRLSRGLRHAVEALQWPHPTPIQAQAIPLALAGRDILGSAVTGSGKTAAFLIPILERLLQRLAEARRSAKRVTAATRALIVLPTRELAVQCHSVLETLCRYACFRNAAAAAIPLRTALLVGGLSLHAQEQVLRQAPDVVVGTPGRLIDHVRNSMHFTLEDVEVLVLDEADRLLQLGFRDELHELLRHCPRRATGRQTLLFSATMDEGVRALAEVALESPEVAVLRVDPTFDTVATLSQEFIRLRERDGEADEIGAEGAQSLPPSRRSLSAHHPQQVEALLRSERAAVLLLLCARTFRQRCIIFFAHKRVAHWFKIVFGLVGLRAAELHGNLTQAQRLQALEAFRDGVACDFLLCTDVAARGLDIEGVETVINYEMPLEMREYVHRVGRTARAGRVGRAVALVDAGSANDRRLMKAVRKHAAATPDAAGVLTDGKALAERKVPPSDVRAWRQRLLTLREDVLAVLQEEQVEQKTRRAEQELTRAHNLLEHAAEIYARPPRTWFQTAREKRRRRRQLGQTHNAAVTTAQGEEAVGRGEDPVPARRSRDKKKEGRRTGVPRHDPKTTDRQRRRPADRQTHFARQRAAKRAKRVS